MKTLKMNTIETGNNILFTPLTNEEMHKIQGGEERCECKKHCEHMKCGCYTTTSNAAGDKSTTTSPTIPISIGGGSTTDTTNTPTSSPTNSLCVMLF